MSDWKPKVRPGLRWETLSLSAEEGFLLSRIDGTTSVAGLTHLTGLSQGQVELTLQKLASDGAIDPPAPRAAASSSSSSSSGAAAPFVERRNTARRPVVLPTDEGDVPEFSADKSAEDAARTDTPASSDDIRAALDEMSDDDLELPALMSLEGDDTAEGDAVLDDMNEGDGAGGDARVATDEKLADVEAPAMVVPSDDAPPAEPPTESVSADGASPADGDAGKGGEEDEGAPSKEDADATEVEEGNYRKLFETQLHDLPQEEREKLARTESGPTLLALCFDPVPQVIHGILENPQVGFPHARLIARHHRTPQGIDAVFGRGELARDGMVQRYLLANPMLQDVHLKKLLQPKRLAVIYKWALSRDLPEKNRSKVRNILRSRWSTAEGDERANLIFATEGRILTMLIGIPIDSQTTMLLCARTIHSVMLIQNLARFASTPPNLLVHLLKQAACKRQVHLRNMIFQHPNCPSSEKRKTH